MTDEERQKLIAELRAIAGIKECEQAADEIEQLASELKREESESEHYVRLAFIDAGANPAMTWKREAERLAESLADLVKWKAYKDEHGTDATYELGKERAWRKAEAALAQSDVEPNDRVVHRDPSCEKIAAVRKAIKEAWLVHGEKTDFDADNLALAAIAALAQSDAGPVALDPIFWEACECLAEWAEIPNVTKYAFSIYKRTMEILPKLKAIFDAAPPRPDASAWLTEAADISEQAWQSLPPRPDASAGLIEDFRKNAEECYQAYKETHDPADGAAAEAYNECADALAAERSRK